MEPKNDEGRLRKTLFCNYDRDNRPILRDGPITIRFKMIIKGFTFSDTDSKLVVSTWLAMTWTDDHLKWNPNDYNKLTSITQSSQTIWQPDLAMYNSDVASATEESCKDANCVISSTGSVSCIPPCSHTAKCMPNYNRWPFDEQNCTLHIGTWVNSGDEVDFNVSRTVLTEQDLSSQDMQWRLIGATYTRNPGNFSDTQQTYPSLKFTFLMERHSGSHSATIFIPAFALVLLNLITLWVDSEHNHRFILLALSLLSHFLYMQHLFWIVPHNGDTVPDILFGEYFHLNVSLQKFGTQLDTNDDDINLVESQPNDKPNNKKVTQGVWRTLGNIIDRVLFATLSIFYICMMARLLPEDFLDAKNPKSVVVVGY
ncbi:neuronal acetylcholine receptor subunit non-alpha-3-like [Sitodiplosis mosellana]|uniref:neuronal acetylcholine receptor subunit non-alpha-3-like n=1 Tax=Sitodiplosis mosellana TaxID=263140 RepID=UPI002444961A|nr:neuronal acetylcholine receptor subunit non-alpha-3-like [Sitodiplosis mosellana]